jgi:hypothetical protein
MFIQIADNIPKVTLFTILSIVLFISSCNISDNHSDNYQTAPGVLTATVTKTDSIGHFISTIDSSGITNPPITSLGRALTFKVNNGLLQKTFIHIKSSESKPNMVVFLLATSADGQVISPSGMYRPGPGKYNEVVSSDSLTGEATVHIFFVKGIGDLPKHPVTVEMKLSNDSTKTMQLDPGHSTLPGRFAIHLNKGNIGTLPDNWKLGLAFNSNEQMEQESPDLYLLFASRIKTAKKNTLKGIMRPSDVRFSIYHGGMEVSDFDFFVMLLK